MEGTGTGSTQESVVRGCLKGVLGGEDRAPF